MALNFLSLFLNSIFLTSNKKENTQRNYHGISQQTFAWEGAYKYFMDPRLTSLLELQEAMSEQKELEDEFNHIPKRRNEILSIINNLKQEAQDLEESIKSNEIEQKNRELELQENQSLRVKKEAQLHSIKSEKEYNATISEIENLDRKNARSEEIMLEMMDKIENEKKQLTEKKQEIENAETKYQEELKSLDEKESTLAHRVEQAQAKSNDIINQIDPNLYRRFKMVFDAKGGVALASANDGHCGMCSMKLTPRLVHLAKRGQDIVVCEGCSRFLYWDNSLEEDQVTEL